MFRNKRGNKMTDEEKAEEYAENEQCANCSNPQYCQGKDECYDFANVKSHFLAGLEASKDMAETDLATIAYMQGAEQYKLNMMNKISFALKDPVLQMGFEVICSKLSRLEKENAEFDCQMNRNKYCYSCANATDRCFRNEIGCPCEKYKSYKDLNEWHYPSKGEYPKEGEDVLCYCKCRTEIKFYCIGHTIIGGDNKIRWWSSNRPEELEVYAWREVVFPEEIKENEN